MEKEENVIRHSYFCQRKLSVVCVSSSELDTKMENGRTKAGCTVYFNQMLIPDSKIGHM